MDFEDVLKRRRSVRKFTDQQVRQETIIQIMNEARLTPTWANAQETRIYVASKNTARIIRKEYEDASAKGLGLSDYSFTAKENWSDREKKAMKGFEKEIDHYMEENGISAADFFAGQNCLFNAPCMVFLTLPKDAATWSKSDLGAYEMMILMCAANRGVDSIVAQAFVKFPDIIRKHLPVPEDEDIIIGIGLGYEDEEDKINRFRSSRKSLTTTFMLKE